MKALFSIIFLALADSISAAPTASSYVVHEKREIQHPRGNGQVKRGAILSVSIALKQRNLENGYDYLMEVADPSSTQYGQHWTPAQIAEVFAPSEDSISAIKSWLAENGIDENQAQVSKGQNWIRFNAKFGEVESLLRTEYRVHTHKATGKQVSGCDEYSIPEALREHIDFIKPTIQFDSTAGHQRKLRRNMGDVSLALAKRNNNIVTPVRVKEIQDAPLREFTTPLATMTCGTLMTPVGDQIIGGSFDNLFDGLDASYCTAAGGNVSPYDPIYPDAFTTESQSGYNAKDCGKSLLHRYVTRMCNEFMKLGLQGVTVILSSGDEGVAGAVGGSCAEFIPGFPATCPFVTVVGSTTLSSSTSLIAGKIASTSFASGGGFSNVFPVPSYQSSAISNFMNQHKPLYSPLLFNSTGRTRGYPDLSAVSQNFYTITNGVESILDGTSTSAPAIGSIITLINNERINAGKAPVGFINPTIYANPSSFNDITVGSNPGCGTDGFEATEGWDPVSGLGLPNFPKLSEVFMALP